MITAVNVLFLGEPHGLSLNIRTALKHMSEFHIISEAELAEVGAGTTVALVFLDEIWLMDGLACIASLKERQPKLRALVTFRALIADDLRALLAAGADAFVGCSKSPQDLRTALLALAERSECLVLSELPPAMDQNKTGALTHREAEVLRLLSAGFSNKEVARRLALSVRTVETHRFNLRRKTRTGRLKDLVSLSWQLGLAPVVESEPLRRGVDYRYRQEGDSRP